MKKTKTALFHSAMALLLCISMLIGSTFAWFTDNVTTVNNIITSGNLDLEMYWTDDLDSGVWYNVEDGEHNTIFSYDNWEPGYTDVKYIKLVNAGKLALNYQLAFSSQGGVGKLAEVINVFYANEAVNIATRDDLYDLNAIGLLDNVMNGGATAEGTLLADGQYSPLHPSGEVIVTLAMNMITTAGNEYQNEDAGKFTITALATQASFESDSFGSDYDSNATFPEMPVINSASAPVTPVDNKVTAGGVWIIGDSISAYVPENTLLDEGVTELVLTTKSLDAGQSNIVATNGEAVSLMDVHIEGISEENTVPIVIQLGAVLPQYLNIGNYHLYHEEDGQNNEMTSVSSVDDLTSHNQFYYDSDTGEVTLAMASFSEVTLLIDTVNKWDGAYDYDFLGSGTEADPYIISKADELAGLSARVGGMDGDQTAEDFNGKYFKLISFLDMGGEKNIFYPIGYHNSTYSYEKTEGGTVTSNVSSFEGTFDGNGYTIYNIYQNTWSMFGDYNSGYSGTPNHYKDAMGLFGYVLNGTVKNLGVDSFSSDGEFTPTGVIAAYAENSTFQNIAITNCNPRVYNTGNGGIVGIDSSSDSGTLKFKDITVDSTNKISALWGSWDVGCGGILGMHYGNEDVSFENCHVAAQIDVYNDVCGNYQYYWYRYAGMMIGTIRKHTTVDGYTVPDLSGITATGCTVRFDEWNDYYYCELVENSLASYTHDHQFSRLEVIEDISEIKDGETWTRTGNFILFADDDNRLVSGSGTCYHIRKDANGNLYEHKHTEAGYEDGIDEDGDGENDLKEDKQRYYLPFNQLFQGYGWGVKNIAITGAEGSNLNTQAGYENLDITILARAGDSVVKFQSMYAVDHVVNIGSGAVLKLSDVLQEVENLGTFGIKYDNIYVTLENANKTITKPIATYTPAADSANWGDGIITFDPTVTSGQVELVIQDYYYCTPTVIIFNIAESVDLPDDENDTESDWVALDDVTQIVPGNNYIIVNNETGLTLSNSYSDVTGQFALTLSSTIEDYWQFTEGAGGLTTEENDGVYYEPTSDGTIVETTYGTLTLTYVDGLGWIIYNYDGTDDLNYLTDDSKDGSNAVTSHPENFGEEIPAGSYWIIYGLKSELPDFEEGEDEGSGDAASDAKFTFAFAADTHIGASDDALIYLRNMYADLLNLSEDGLDLDALLVTADLTDNSYDTAWNAFSCVAQWYAPRGIKTYTTLGNHDARAWGYNAEEGDNDYLSPEARWEESSTRYDKFVSEINKNINFNGDDKFYYHQEFKGDDGETYDLIVLATESAEKDVAYLSETQLKWFENKVKEIEAAKGTSQNIIVITHQPINHTMYGLDHTQYHVGEQGAELQEIIAAHPQIICLSSHLHTPVDDSKAVNTGDGIFVDCPTLASTAYYRVLEIYDDYMVVKTRYVKKGDGAGNVTGVWIDEYEIKVPLTKTVKGLEAITEPSNHENYVLVNKATGKTLNNALSLVDTATLNLSDITNKWTFTQYDADGEKFRITVPIAHDYKDDSVGGTATLSYLKPNGSSAQTDGGFAQLNVEYVVDQEAFLIYRKGANGTYYLKANADGTGATGSSTLDDDCYWYLKTVETVPTFFDNWTHINADTLTTNSGAQDKVYYVYVNKATYQILAHDGNGNLSLVDVTEQNAAENLWRTRLDANGYCISDDDGDTEIYIKPNSNKVNTSSYTNLSIVYNEEEKAFQIYRTGSSDYYLTGTDSNTTGYVSKTVSEECTDASSYWYIYAVTDSNG